MARRADLVALVLALVVGGCKRHEPHARPHADDAPAQVPRASGPIILDGAWDEAAWSTGVMRGVLVDASGTAARPNSEVRIVRDDHDLLIALYAADENIVRGDRFELALGYLAFSIDPTGALVPPIAGVRAKAGLDEGTLDDPRDDDEEWVVELAVPLAMLPDGGRPVPVVVKRCDTPKDGIPRCGQWSAPITLP